MILCKIQAHIHVYTSLVGVVTCVREEQYDYMYHLSLDHCNTFLPSTWRLPCESIRTYTNVTSRYNGLYLGRVCTCALDHTIARAMENFDFLDVALAAYESGTKEQPMIKLDMVESREKQYEKMVRSENMKWRIQQLDHVTPALLADAQFTSQQAGSTGTEERGLCSTQPLSQRGGRYGGGRGRNT